ncbi:MAG: cell division protein SepF [Clostridia bacterium]
MGIMNRFTDLFKENIDDTDIDTNDDGNETDIDETPIQTRPNNTGIASATALEMKVCRPTKFEDVTEIAEHLLAKRTVVLNLEDANKETIVRIIDFLFGVTFAIEGQLKRVSSSTYVITPKNVEVTGEQKDKSKRDDTKPRELF